MNCVMQREEIVLEPAQQANLKHFRASYHGRPETVSYLKNTVPLHTYIVFLVATGSSCESEACSPKTIRLISHGQLTINFVHLCLYSYVTIVC